MVTQNERESIDFSEVFKALEIMRDDEDILVSGEQKMLNEAHAIIQEYEQRIPLDIDYEDEV